MEEESDFKREVKISFSNRVWVKRKHVRKLDIVSSMYALIFQ